MRRDERCGNGEDEMVRIKVEKGYMTTPGMAWIRADKKTRKGKGR